MGYWIYLDEAQVNIPRERLALAKQALQHLVGHFRWVKGHAYTNQANFEETLQRLRWRPVMDRQGNVYSLEFNGWKIGNDYAPFEVLAPFVQADSFIHIRGEDERTWGWRFNGSHVELEYGYDSDYPIYQSSLLHMPEQLPEPHPLTPSLREQVRLLVEQILETQDEQQRIAIYEQLWRIHFLGRGQTLMRALLVELACYHEDRGIALLEWWLRRLLAQPDTEQGDPGALGLSIVLTTLQELHFLETFASVPRLLEIGQQATQRWVSCMVAALHSGNLYLVRYLQLLAQKVRSLPAPCLEIAITQLITYCEDPWEMLRQVAAKSLGLLGSVVLQQRVEAILNSDRPERQAAALIILSTQPERITLDVLKAFLEHEHVPLRAAAVLGLGSRPELEARTLLKAAIQDSSQDVKLAVCQASVQVGGPEALGLLISIYERGYGDAVRCAALEAMGRLGEHTSIRYLLQVVESRDYEEKMAALWALCQPGVRPNNDQIQRLLGDKTDQSSLSRDNQQLRHHPLGLHLMARTMQPAETLQHYDNWSVQVRRMALQIQGTQGPAELLRQLRAFCVEEEPLKWFQLQGIFLALETLGAQKTVADLNDIYLQKAQGFWLPEEFDWYYMQDVERAHRALKALKQELPIASNADVVAEEFVADGELSARQLHALGKLGAQAPFERISAALTDEDEIVSNAAASALKALSEYVPLEPLVPLLERNDILHPLPYHVRDAIITILGQRLYEPAIPYLFRELKGDASYTASQALLALVDNISVDEVMTLWRSDHINERAAAIKLCTGMGRRAPISILLEALDERARYLQQLPAAREQAARWGKKIAMRERMIHRLAWLL
ncbi:hypothetical protein KDK_78550 [Dictyobacter kobayashii]|uniref:HEAT repeat domain-containing protein n=2 Tax=Dictyobacter kobayashii TaxID=2014872 RepID=A0A402AY98_9CHLR|nr:hypothetical protein KDK_78550 [Dictyobacter kobayashii]